MSDKRENRKTKYAVNLQSSFQILREKQIVCDFTIKVDEEFFPVHRAVLAARSKYFEAMFSHNMLEAQEGMVNMKEVTIEAVKQCIEFMYTGEADLNLGNVQDILFSSCLIQIDELTELCFDCILENLTPENCLCLKHLAKKFNNETTEVAIEEYIRENFASVIQTDEYRKLSFNEVSHYVGSCTINQGVIWDAITRWIHDDLQNREKHLTDFLKITKIEQFKLDLIAKIWKNRLVSRSIPSKEYISSCILKDSRKFMNKIDIETCFLLKESLSFNKELKDEKSIGDFVDNYMAKNLEEIHLKNEFNLLSVHDVLKVLSLTSPSLAGKASKWEAIVRWTEHDKRERKSVFSTLLEAISVDQFPPEFIENTIRTELSVKLSSRCKDVLLDAYFKITTKLRDPVLQERPSIITGMFEDKSHQTDMSNLYHNVTHPCIDRDLMDPTEANIIREEQNVDIFGEFEGLGNEDEEEIGPLLEEICIDEGEHLSQKSTPERRIPYVAHEFRSSHMQNRRGRNWQGYDVFRRPPQPGPRFYHRHRPDHRRPFRPRPRRQHGLPRHQWPPPHDGPPPLYGPRFHH